MMTAVDMTDCFVPDIHDPSTPLSTPPPRSAKLPLLHTRGLNISAFHMLHTNTGKRNRYDSTLFHCVDPPPTRRRKIW